MMDKSEERMELSFVTLDVFTRQRFSGNPLAIVNVPTQHRAIGQAQKQLIAREFNFSETVFLHARDPDSPASRSREIDIFTPTEELPFAGHPTIGTACYLLLTPETAVASDEALVTKAGRIPISLSANGTEVAAEIPHDVHIHAAGVPRQTIVGMHPNLRDHDLQDNFDVVSIVKGMTFVLVQLPNVAALATLSPAVPPFNVVLDEGWDEGLVGGYYYVRMPNLDSASTAQLLRTRMIMPMLEDPATGIAASALACFLSLSAEESPATFRYIITQGVEMGRKSDIGLEVVTRFNGVHAIDKVTLAGGAIIVTKGTLLV